MRWGEQVAEIVRRANAGADLPDGVDVEEVIRFAVAPIFHRLCITCEPVTTQDALRVADAGRTVGPRRCYPSADRAALEHRVMR